MAVQFEFVLNDIDAENLFQFLHGAENKCNSQIMDELATPKHSQEEMDMSKARIEWLEGHKVYIGDIIKRMLEKQTRKNDSLEHNV